MKSDTNVIDVESEFCRKFSGPEEIESIISKNSREIIQKNWRKAIEEAFTIMTHGSTKKDLNLLICHPLYYKSSTREFFSVFDTGFIKKMADEKKMEISHVILINDDIYDIYKRLTEPTKLYGKEAFVTFLENYSENLKIPHTAMQNNKQAYLSWIQHSLNSLISWKDHEILLAQNFANQLNCRFLYWAIKQDPDILKSWLKTNGRIFYISHPITEPRTFHQKNKKWPPLVNIINNMQSEFAKKKLFTVTPTSIDELRFERKDQNYTGKLTKRWPVTSKVKRSFKNSNLVANKVDHDDILFPLDLKFKVDDFTVLKKKYAKIDNIRKELNSVFTSLEMSVVGSLANRDHSLVMHTDGIIVFEPWSKDKNEVHGGVGKELDYLLGLNQSYEKVSQLDSPIQHPRKLCVVFLKSTLKEIVKHEFFKEKMISKLRSIISKEYDLRLEIAERIMDSNGKLTPRQTFLGQLGGDQTIMTRIVTNLDSHKKEAIIRQFLDTTMGLPVKAKTYLSVIFITKIQDLNKKNTIAKIHKFLTTKNHNIDWEKEVWKEAKKNKLID